MMQCRTLLVSFIFVNKQLSNCKNVYTTSLNPYPTRRDQLDETLEKEDLGYHTSGKC